MPAISRAATAPVVTLARARVTVTAIPDGPVLKDTVASFPPSDAPLSLDISLVLTTPSQAVEVRIAGITAAGDTVYRSIDSLTVTAGAVAGEPVETRLLWVAPDTAVKAMRVLPRDTTFRTSDVAPFRVVARRADSTVFANPIVGWTSADTMLATFSSDGRLTAKQSFSSLRVIAGLGNGLADTTFVTAVAPVATVTLAPDSLDAIPYDTIQLVATMRDAAGAVLVGRAVAWAALDGNASVNAAGLVIATGEGKARVVATSETKADTAIVNVKPAPVADVELPADSLVLARGDTATLVPVLRDHRGHALGGRVVTFASSNAGVSVEATGLVTGVRADSIALVVVASEGLADTVSVRVARRGVASVVVSPDTNTILVGGTRQLVATPQDSAGAENRDHPVTWTSVDAAIAAVTDSGVVSGVSVGTTVVRATSGGATGGAGVTVLPVPVRSVVISPEAASVLVGATVPLSAATHDSTGAPMTGRVVTWRSLDEAIAIVSEPLVGQTVSVRGVATGSARIVAGSEGFADTAVVSVNPVPVASVDATPDPVTVRIGGTTTLAFVARDSVGGALSGRTAAWLSKAPGVATVGETSGVVSGVSVGSTFVVAIVEGKRDSVVVNVTEIPVGAVVVSPRSPSVVERDSVRLTATVTDSTGAATERAVAWSSANESIATVSESGWVTGVLAGGAYVRAVLGEQRDSAFVTVTQRVLACSASGGTDHSDRGGTETWTRAASPHRVTGTLSFDAGSVLTVEPGAFVCVSPGAHIGFSDGARLDARGTVADRIVFTAADTAARWLGLRFAGAAGEPSVVRNAVVSFAGDSASAGNRVAILADAGHVVHLDSVRVRRAVGSAVRFGSASSLRRSTVDTTHGGGNAVDVVERAPAGVAIEGVTIRAAGGTGLRVGADSAVVVGDTILAAARDGASISPLDATLLRGLRIDGSGAHGLNVNHVSPGAPAAGSAPPRITRSARAHVFATYDAYLSLFPDSASQDSLMTAGGADSVRLALTLSEGRRLVVRRGLTLRPLGSSTAVRGMLAAEPGAVIALEPNSRIAALGGGVLKWHGTAEQPIRLAPAVAGTRIAGVRTLNPAAGGDSSVLRHVRIEQAGASPSAVAVIFTDTGHVTLLDTVTFTDLLGRAVLLRARGIVRGASLASFAPDTVHAIEVRAGGEGSVVEGTTVDGAQRDAIYVAASDVRLERNVVRNSLRDGLWVTGRDIVVRRNVSTQNGRYGLYAAGDSTLTTATVDSNLFILNADLGVETGTIEAARLDARRNYWGSESGPSGEGGGDGVGALVDFDPWLLSDMITEGSARFSAASCAAAGTSHTGTLTGARTWTRAASPHRLGDGNVFVEGGTLTIEPGALVCGAPGTSLVVRSGGRLEAVGTPTDSIRFLAQDSGEGWGGLVLVGDGVDSSRVSHAIVANAGRGGFTGFPAAIFVDGGHRAAIQDVRVRQSANRGIAFLFGGGGRVTRAVVDTVSGSEYGLDIAGAGTVVEGTVVRQAGALGIHVNAPNVVLRGDTVFATPQGVALSGTARETFMDGLRIVGASTIGLQVAGGDGVQWIADGSTPPRVQDGAGVPYSGSIDAFLRLYPTAASQDSLRGNLAGDTIAFTGGIVAGGLIVARPELPWRVQSSLTFGGGITLQALPGASVRSAGSAMLRFLGASRLDARGTPALPVEFTAIDSTQRWGGIVLRGGAASVLVNARLAFGGAAGEGDDAAVIATHDGATILVDSARFRQITARGALFWSPGSSVLRSTFDSVGTPLDLPAATTVDSNTFSHSVSQAIFLNGSGILVRGNRFLGGAGIGIRVRADASAPVIRGNQFVGNAGEGVFHDGTDETVDATDNWWGDACGPTGPAGDGVGGQVTVAPWRTSPDGGAATGCVAAHDATAEFSTTSNPTADGRWRAGWTAALGSPLVTYTTLAGGNGWRDPSIEALGTPAYWKNTGTSTAFGVPAGMIALHPGCNANQFSVLRWTAAEARSYRVRARFFAGDVGETDAYVLRNGRGDARLFEAPATSANPSHDATYELASGEYLDFVVGTLGSCTSDNTPITVVIEPGAPHGLSDLTVASVAVPSSAAAGSSATVNFSLRNGGAATGAFDVHASLRRLSDGVDVSGASVASVPSMSPGEVGAGSVSLPVPGDAAPGAYEIHVAVDCRITGEPVAGRVRNCQNEGSSEGAVSETDDFNNFGRVAITVTAPERARTWTGAVSPAWSDPANWSPASVPGPSDTAKVAPAARQPALTSSVTVARVEVAAGATLDAGTFSITGQHVVDGTLAASGIYRPGHTSALRGAFPALEIDGTVGLLGRTTASAVTVRNSGTLMLAGRTLDVAANFVVTGDCGGGRVVMTDVADSVIVRGNAFFEGGRTGADAGALLTAGVLRVFGNFSQTACDANAPNFAAAGAHKVVLDGPAAKSVAFGRPEASFFNHLELAGTGAVTFTNANARGSVVATTTQSILGTLTAAGTGVVDLAAGIGGTGKLVVSGGPYALSGNARRLDVTGAATMTNQLAVSDTLELRGRLTVNHRTLTVGRFLNVTGSCGGGQLVMQNADDVVDVDGNATFEGERTDPGLEAILVAGTLRVAGNFLQSACDANTTSFQARGTHRTIFDGTSPQTVRITRAGGASYLNHVTVANPAGIFFDDAFAVAEVRGDLAAPAGQPFTGTLVIAGTGTVSWAGTIGGPGGVLSITGAPTLAGARTRTLRLQDATTTALAAPLIVDDTVEVRGRLFLGGNALTVNRQLWVTGSCGGGRLVMTTPGDSVDVNGDALFEGARTDADVEESFTEGVLRVSGAFTQQGCDVNAQSYAAARNHRTVLDGTTPQVARLTRSGVSRIRHLELENPAGVSFGDTFSPMFVTGSVTVRATTAMTGFLHLAESAVLNGDAALGGTGVVRIVGPNTTARGTIPNLEVNAASRVALLGRLAVTGDATTRGDLVAAGRTLAIGGNLLVTGSCGGGRLVMTDAADSVVVAGHAQFEGARTDGGVGEVLRAGVLRVAGNFTQEGCDANTTSFLALGTHKTVLDGAGKQLVRIGRGGETGSAFNRLELRKPAGSVVLTTSLIARDSVVLSGRDTVPAGLTLDGRGALVLRADTRLHNLGTVNYCGAFTAEPGSVVTGTGVGPRSTCAPVTAVTVTPDPATVDLGGTVQLTAATTPAGRFVAWSSSDEAIATVDANGLVSGVATGSTTILAVSEGVARDVPLAVLAPAPIGSTRSWTGAVSTDFANGGNWSPAGAPTADDTIFVRATALQPRLGAHATVGGVRLATDASFDLNAFTLTVAGDVAAGNTITNGLVVMTGAAVGSTLSGTFHTVEIRGPVALDGPTTATASLLVAAGRLTVGPHALTVNGTFGTNGSGSLSMQDAAGSVTVNGPTGFSGSGTGTEAGNLLTAGTLRVRHDFSQGSSGASTQAFQATAGHLTIIDGDSPSQRIFFGEPATNRFGTLRIAKPSGSIFLPFLTPAAGAIEIASPTTIVGDGGVLRADGAVSVAAGARLTIAEVQVGGGIAVTDSLAMAGTNVELFGAGQTVSGFLGRNLEVAGLATLGGDAVASGNVTITSDAPGRLAIGTHTLRVGGSLITALSGVLDMQGAGAVIVAGDATFGGGPSTGSLTAGTLRVAGSFTEARGPRSTDPFRASGTHRTVLDGSGDQAVRLDEPSTNGFQHLDVLKPAGIASFQTMVPMLGDLDVGASLAIANGTTTDVGGNLRLRPASSLVNDGTLRYCGTLTVETGATITGNPPAGCEPVTAVAVSPTSSSVAIAGTVQLTATTTPPGRFVAWSSDDPGTATVDASGLVTGVSPGTTTIRATSEGIVGTSTLAVLTAAPAGVTKSWIGDASANWNEGANWSPAGVPAGTDTVFIRAFRPNVPTLDAGAAIGGLLMESAATMALGNATLTVGGDVLGGRITGAGTSRLVMTGAKTGAAVSTRMPQLIVRGPVDVGADLTIDQGISVESGGVLDLAGRRATAAFLQTDFDGRLLMRDAAGALTVAGNVTFFGDATAGDMTAGLLSVGQHFRAGHAATAKSSFLASGSHVTRLVGTAPAVTMLHNLQQFAGLEIAHASGTASFENSGGHLVRATGAVRTTHPVAVNGTLRLADAASLDTRPGALTGNLLVNPVGSAVTLAGRVPAITIDGGTTTLADSVRTATTVDVLRGTLALGGHRLNVGTHFQVLNTSATGGKLAMLLPGDTLDVAGLTLIEGRPNVDSLTAGVIVARGSFRAAGNAFNASGTHTLVFTDAGGGTFEAPVSTGTSFAIQHLVVDHTSGTLAFNSSALVRGDAEIRSAVSFLSSAILTVSGTLTVRATSTLDIDGGLRYCGGITEEGGTYLNKLPVSCGPAVASVTIDADSLRVLAAGQTGTFSATPRDAGGNPLAGRVIRWSSLDPAIATVVATSGVATAAAEGSARIVARSETRADTSFFHVGVPTPAAATITWRGGDATAPTDWDVAANWSPARVPLATDVVWIPVRPSAVRVASPSTIAGLHMQSAAPLVVDATELVVLGDVDATGAAVSGAGAITVRGSGRVIRGNLSNVNVDGSTTLGGRTHVSGMLQIGPDGSPSRVIVGGHTLEIDGALRVLGGAETGSRLYMRSNADSVIVHGDALYQGAPGVDSLGSVTVAGVLRLSGNFTQSGAGAPNGFVGAGGHETVFDATGAQAISLSSTGMDFSASRFNSTTIAPGADVTLASDVVVAGFAVVHGSLSVPASRALELGQSLLVQAGGSVSNAGLIQYCNEFRNSGTFSGNAPVSCQTVATVEVTPGATTVREGGTVTLTAVARNARGGDIAGAVFGWTSDNETFATVSPLGVVTGVARGTASIIASSGGRQGASVVTVTSDNVVAWVGGAAGSPSAWTTAANWSPARVPTSTDTAMIGAAAQVPTLTAGQTVGGLVVADGGTVDLGNANLAVNGDVRTEGTGRVAMTDGMLFLTGSGSIRGHVAGRVATQGAYALAGDLTVETIVSLGAPFTIGGHTLTVGGNLHVGQFATLVMTNASDSVDVGGDTYFQGAPSTGTLTAGVLVARGSFYTSNDAPDAFTATPGHRTVFAGVGAQEVAFLTPGASRFGGLTTRNFGAGVTFATTAHAAGAVELDGAATIVGTALFKGYGDVFIVGTVVNDGRAQYCGSGGVTGLGSIEPNRLYGCGEAHQVVIADGARSVSVGQTLALSGTARNAADSTLAGLPLTWSSLNTSAANVDASGVVSGVADGVAPIVASRGAGSTLVADTVNVVVGSGVAAANAVTWVGGGASNPTLWSNPENWSPPRVPTITDSAIVGPAPNEPVLGEAHAVGTLVVLDDAGLTFGLNRITAHGDVHFAPLSRASFADPAVAALWMVGDGTTMRGLLPPLLTQADVSLAGGTFVQGGLTIGGVSRSLDVNGFRLDVGGSLEIPDGAGGASLRMRSAADTVRVQGDATFGGRDDPGALAAGTLIVVGGNFRQVGTGGAAGSFAAGPAHRTVIEGGFPRARTIAFDSPGASRFGLLEVNDQDNRFATNAIVQDTLRAVSPVTIPAGVLVRTEHLRLFAGGTLIDGELMYCGALDETAMLNPHVRKRPIACGAVHHLLAEPSATAITVGQTLSVSVTALNAADSALAGRAILRSSLDPRVLSQSGETFTGASVGAARIEVGVDGVLDTVSVTVAPAGTTAVWTGAASSAWEIAANWADGTIPDAADVVYVPAAPAPMALVSQSTSIAALRVELGASVQLAPSVSLDVAGSVRADGVIAPTAFMGDGVLTVRSGALQGNLPRTFVAGPVALSGNVSTAGSVEVANVGSRLALAGHRMFVQGSFSVIRGASLAMRTAADTLEVDGHVTFESADLTDSLTAGVLRTYGNVEVTAGYGASGSHTLVLEGTEFAGPLVRNLTGAPLAVRNVAVNASLGAAFEAVSVPGTLAFGPSSGNAFFRGGGTLDLGGVPGGLAREITVQVGTTLRLTDSLRVLASGVLTGSGRVVALGKLANDVGAFVNPSHLTLTDTTGTGHLDGNLLADTVVFALSGLEGTQHLAPTTTSRVYRRLELQGHARLSGRVALATTLDVATSGRIIFGGSTLEVAGNAGVFGGLMLQQTTDSLIVMGAAVLRPAFGASSMGRGVIALGGSLDADIPQEFYDMRGTGVSVKFIGTGAQLVSTSVTNRFWDVVVQNPSGVQFQNSVTTIGGVEVLAGGRLVTGAGTVLDVKGVLMLRQTPARTGPMGVLNNGGSVLACLFFNEGDGTNYTGEPVAANCG